MAHITGGGLVENIARLLPAECDAVLKKGSWEVPPVFDFLRRLGTSRAEMFKVFNMGVGYVLILRPRFTSGVLDILESHGERPFVLGRVQRGAGRVRIS
jgi:phosphoribosylformylglycinamidine cyclo-ligase